VIKLVGIMPKKHLEDSLNYIKQIGDFCVEREKNDRCRALFYISSSFESTAVLFQLLLDRLDTLEFKMPGESIKIDPCEQIKNLIADQSKFIFIITMSSLEFTAKKISLQDGLPIKNLLGKKKNVYLRDIVRVSSEKQLGLITFEEKKEWDFFIDIRNKLVHNNAIPDKKDLCCEVYGISYSFEKGKEITANIQSLFIFSKRAVDLFYNWSQKHEKYKT